MQIIYLSVVMLLHAYCIEGRWHLRVYKGTEDIHNEFPFVVALYYGPVKGCSGSLLSSRWVITAGHCIHLISPDVITIRHPNFKYSNAKGNKSMGYFQAIEMHSHPSYNRVKKKRSETIFNDIGLVFTEEIPIRTFVKVSPKDYRKLPGQNVKYAGYGATEKNDKMSQKSHLQIGEGVVAACPVKKDGFQPSICVIPNRVNSQMISPGDSGGPLLWKGQLVAMASGGETEWGAISIFTPVSKYITWIQGLVYK